MNGQIRDEECVAAELLKTFVDQQKYKNLCIEDKPDLVENKESIGVEVVCACNEKEKEARSCIHKAIESCTSLSDKILKKINNNEICLYNHKKDGPLCGYSIKQNFNKSLEILKKQIEIKHEKLKEYTPYTTFELFIFDQTDCLDENSFHSRNKTLLDYYKAKITNEEKSIAEQNDVKSKPIMHFSRIYIFRYGLKKIDVLDVENINLLTKDTPKKLKNLYSK